MNIDERVRPTPPPPPPRRGVGRLIVRGLGQTFVTLGVVILLFVVYEVWITDLFGERKQAAATTAIDQQWAQAQETVESTSTVVVTDPAQLVTDPRERTPQYQTLTGQGFAKIYVPSFGADYAFTIVEGTDPDDLYIGPGHYPDSQMPGQPGNFAVAGHRVSKGSPFNDLNLLNACDAMVVETQDDWFVYRVLPMTDQQAGWNPAADSRCTGVEVPGGEYGGLSGRVITVPSDYAQVLPVPGVASATVPSDAMRLITLTTCHPQFSDAERMIIHGELVTSYAKSDGFVPPEMQER
ncbi:class E sortase [Nakamurella flavida]|uniref:Class E sortase n=1 Tax=Nakamurella flavida TaxID=363630 RepID=A0A939C7J4_9ACTN|nr:class E sortase [Nakamurella flavida]MBM9478232.1 class E sortase [Nakamurella flavida]MDP9778545.1 sortase (surface protein transpeptidase) [Nakamurella flavida]